MFLFEPLTIEHQCLRGNCTYEGNHFNPNWVLLFTRNKHNITTLQAKYKNLVKTTTQPVLLCFPDVIVGLSILTDHALDTSIHGRLPTPEWPTWGLGGILWSFRNYTMDLARIAQPIELDSTHDVVILTKGKHSHSGQNVDYTAVMSRLQVYNSSFTVLPPVSIEKYTIPEQMKFIASSKVIISAIGSTSFAGLWLPRGGTLILLERAPGERLDISLYSNMAHIKVHYLQPEETIQIVRVVLVGIDNFPKVQK